MAQYSKVVPLKKIISSQFGKEKSEKYLLGIDFSKSDTVYLKTSDLYQKALNNLLDGYTEKAINYIVFALDIDRSDKLILHLAKVMIFSLSQFLLENNTEMYKNKYSCSLEEAETKIKKKIKTLNEMINKTNKEINKLDEFIEESSKSFFFRLFKAKKFIKQKDEIRQGSYDSKLEIDIFKKDLVGLEKLLKIDEYVRLLSLVIEVCVFPSRFEWILSK